MLGGLQVFSVLRARMNYQQARQKVLAENIANADTPGYRGRDLVAFDMRGAGRLPMTPAASQPVRTAEGHLPGVLTAGSFDEPRSQTAQPYETTPAGTAVSLEDEMMKLAANQADYQAATTLYAKSLSILKIAIGKSA